MTSLNFELLSTQVTSFRRGDLWGDEFAHCISRVTLEWGGIEYLLFCVLQAIDYKRATDWAEMLFAPRSIQARKKIVREEVSASVGTSYQQYIDLLVGRLDLLQTIQNRRNLLAHGLWLTGRDDRSFRIQPLNFNDVIKAVEDAIEIDMDYLVALIKDIEALKNGLSSLAAEMSVHQQLKKWDRL